MKRNILITLHTALLSALLLWAGAARATDNIGMEMDFRGTLVDEPCTVDPDDTDIQLDFGTIIDEYLYLNTRTHSQPFTIHLEDCDIDDWPGEGTVTVRFEGTEDAALPGYLAMSDTTIGAAVGLENGDGTALSLGKTSVPIKLADGSVALNFKAFVEGEPKAITDQTIKLGDFSATATFFLDYP
jgi:type 1 fimbria pilin